MESLGKGEWGSVNPAFNKDKISQFASGLGDVLGTAPMALLAAVALPEGGAAAGVMTALRLGRLGMFGLRAIPMAAMFGSAGGSKAYDDAKASGASDQQANDAATAGAWQAIKSSWPCLLTGGLAGAAEKAILPTVVSPLVRGITHAVLQTAGNMVASGIGRVAEGGKFGDIGDSVGQDMAWGFGGGFQAAHEQSRTTKAAAVAQDIAAGSDPIHQSLVRASQDPSVDPAARQKAAELATTMKINAEKFLKDAGIPQNAPGTSADPLAQSISDLHDKAAAIRAKIQTAYEDGTPEAAGTLAQHHADLQDTEAQFHSGTQEMLARVPKEIQARIAKAVAPDVDWDAASKANADNPLAHFATENLGSSLRDQAIPPFRQRAIRQTAIANKVNPDIADHLANQALGAKAVKDITTVLRNGSIPESTAKTLKDMGLLHNPDPQNPNLYHLTEDAQNLLPPGIQKLVRLRPDVVRYTPSPDSAHGNVLYHNAVMGMDNMAKTARGIIPEPAADVGQKKGFPVPETPDTSETKPGKTDNSAGYSRDITEINGIASDPREMTTLNPIHSRISEGEAIEYLQETIGGVLNPFSVEFHDLETDLGRRALSPQTEQNRGLSPEDRGTAPATVPVRIRRQGKYFTIQVEKKFGRVPIYLDDRLLSNRDELRRNVKHEIAEIKYIQKNIEGRFYPNDPAGQRRAASEMREAHNAGLAAMRD